MKTKKIANWLQPLTTAENEVLPGYFKWAWSSRGLSLALNVILIMNLTYYCTDILGLSAALVGTLLLASKIFDGVTDLVVGFIIDRTQSKFGKARPYEICIVLVWIFTVLLFSVPTMSATLEAAYIFVLYAIINSICATFLNGSDAVYLARSVRSEKNRVSVMSFNGAVIMIFSILISILMPQLIAGPGSTKAGWTLIAGSFAIVMGAIGILRFIFIKEVVCMNQEEANDEKANNEKANNEKADIEKIPVMTGLKCIIQNKYVFILAGMLFVANLITNVGSAVNTYYFKYIVGNIGLASVVMLSSLVTPLLLAFFPMLSRKFGTVGLIRYGTAISILGYGLRIVGGTNLATLTIGSLLGGMGIIPVSMMISIYLIECMEYGEWKTGIRVEGILASVISFAGKLGAGIASGAVGLIMGLAGYIGSADVQPDSAKMSIISLFNVLPMILCIIMLILSILFTIDKIMPQVKKELAVKRGA